MHLQFWLQPGSGNPGKFLISSSFPFNAMHSTQSSPTLPLPTILTIVILDWRICSIRLQVSL